MTRLGPSRTTKEGTGPQDGAGTREGMPRERHCALCGQAANMSGPAIERFGEPFCSEGHAEEFAKEVRAARVQARAASQHPTTEIERPVGLTAEQTKHRNWKAYLGKALCWGAPLAAVVFLLGGGGAVLGAAGALLPFLAALACPLGMYFMMRSMSKMGDRDKPGDKGGEK